MSSIRFLNGDARRLPLADGSVHCCVTSPPYFGLRDYGVAGQIGLERDVAAYVASIVDVFREVKRVLRDDGTLWLNMGDSYNAYNGNRGKASGANKNHHEVMPSLPSGHGLTDKGMKPKDLIGVPWRVAFALQADGWYLRQDIVWAKPNPMPESVRDRCTKSHEYLFLLAKSPDYFYDNEAIKEPSVSDKPAGNKVSATKGRLGGGGGWDRKPNPSASIPEFKNKRSVWTITLKPCKEAHFATFPPDLVEPCVKAGTSERGCCPACGAPWVRLVERNRVATRPGADTKTEGVSPEVAGNRDPRRHVTTTVATGWRPSCDCPAADPVPCTVLDPFNGAGTTGLVADRLGRDYVGVELNPEYVAISERRLANDRARRAPKVAAEVKGGVPAEKYEATLPLLGGDVAK